MAGEGESKTNRSKLDSADGCSIHFEHIFVASQSPLCRPLVLRCLHTSVHHHHHHRITTKNIKRRKFWFAKSIFIFLGAFSTLAIDDVS